MKAMFVMRSISLVLDPAEAVGGGGGGLVLEADPAAVAGRLEIGELPQQRQRPGAGLVAARGVGDLHMADPVGVVGDDLVDVVAVDREVVEVGEQSDVGLARPGR